VNQARREVYFECKAAGYRLVSYVSSKALVLEDVPIGENCFVLEGNVIQPGVKIGNDVILWSGNHIGHDATIGDHCFVSSHVVISGHVVIEENCFLGVNATIRDRVRIARDCVVGAGALIMRDTIPGAVYAVRGTRAAPMKSSELDL
jgi:sugar O-acyltransferase (sialic acid O-acetyltransferase NeuD family)